MHLFQLMLGRRISTFFDLYNSVRPYSPELSFDKQTLFAKCYIFENV
jgi:hypothetical protein